MAKPLVFLVAGEPSGDALGAALMRDLVAETGGAVAFAGVGGPEMEAEGLTSLFPMADLSVMGLFEVLPRLARVLRRLRQTTRSVLELRPSVLVTIDSQAFSYHLARRLRPAPCPVVHYVAPTVWAWRPSRAEKVAAVTDRVLLLFPFERPFWDRVGHDTVHVGHPLASANAEDLCRSSPRHAAGPLVAVLPGSRKAEVRRHLPIFREVVARLCRDWPAMTLVIPTVGNVAGEVRRSTRTWPWPLTVRETDSDGRREAMAAADAALAVSGTVALELAACGTPHVIAYRANPLTAAVLRRLITVKYASLVNLTAGEEVNPEYIQERCRAGPIYSGMRRILSDPEVAAKQKCSMKEVMKTLAHPDGPSSRVAAKCILEVIAKDGTASGIHHV